MSNQDGIGGWVPQLFYDLIARVVPGCVAVCSAALALMGLEEFLQFVDHLTLAPKDQERSTLLIVMVGFVVCYVVGWTLSAVKPDMQWLASEKKHEDPKIRVKDSAVQMRLSPEQKHEDSAARTERSVIETPPPSKKKHENAGLMYDEIRLREPAAGARIAKMRAEVTMLACVALAWALSALLSLLRVGEARWDALLTFLCFGLGAVAMEASRRRVQGRFGRALRNHAELLGVSRQPPAVSQEESR